MPTVLISKYRLQQQRLKVKKLLNKNHLTKQEEKWFADTRKKYEADSEQELLLKMSDHPTSIILGQAILETGWGESPFFRKANNIFGVWSFDPEDSRMQARKKRNGQAIHLKKYVSLLESVDDYFLTIAKGPYATFRQARATNRNPAYLASLLTNYSEQREEYTRRLRRVIRHNDLTKYDAFELDPDYFKMPLAEPRRSQRKTV